MARQASNVCRDKANALSEGGRRPALRRNHGHRRPGGRLGPAGWLEESKGGVGSQTAAEASAAGGTHPQPLQCPLLILSAARQNPPAHYISTLPLLDTNAGHYHIDMVSAHAMFCIALFTAAIMAECLVGFQHQFEWCKHGRQACR